MDSQKTKSRKTGVAEMNWLPIEQYIRQNIPGLANEPLEGKPFSNGYSNLTYMIQIGDWQAVQTGLASVTASPGFLTRKDMLALYAKKSGRDISNIEYYLSFAFFKIAGILQQIYYRWKIGEAADQRFGTLGTGVRNLILQAEKAQRGEFF